MKLEGGIEIAAARRRVWDLIVDPIALAACVPGVRDVRQVDDRTFEGSVTAAVGPMEGDFAFSSVITRDEFPDDLDVEVTGLDSVTKSRLEARVHASVAEGADGTSTLRYQAVVTVKGRLSILGEMVLRATAGLMIAQVTKCLRSRLEDPASGTPAPPA